MRFSEEEYTALMQRRQALEEIARDKGLPVPTRNKYRNQRIKVGDVTYDSKKEFARHQQLMMLEQAGKIEGLERQYPFVLVPAVTLDGRRKPAVKYLADFIYYENGELVAEDVKSPVTRKDSTYRLKRHLMVHVHSIEVREI